MKQEDVQFGPGLRSSDRCNSGFMIVQETMDFITHDIIRERNARRLTPNETFETNGTGEATRLLLVGDIGARCDLSASGPEADHDVSSNDDTDIVHFRSK